MRFPPFRLSVEQILSILQSTAIPSPDPRVSKGYVDAYRAVRGLLVNQPPSVDITSPLEGAVYGWEARPLFTATYSDPEVSPDNIYRWHGEVVYSSNVDGALCSSASPPYTCSSTRDELTLGAHIVTATATDAHGATATSQRSITVVNRPPTANIEKPLPADALFAHIPVQFIASVGDQDEEIPEGSVTWTSNKDGGLGAGRGITHLLTAGAHTITVTVTDGKGLTAQDQVAVNVTAATGLPLPTITSPADHIFGQPRNVAYLYGPGDRSGRRSAHRRKPGVALQHRRFAGHRAEHSGGAQRPAGAMQSRVGPARGHAQSQRQRRPRSLGQHHRLGRHKFAERRERLLARAACRISRRCSWRAAGCARAALLSGLNSDISQGPRSAMCGRLRVGKRLSSRRRLGRCSHVFGL